ncbi:MAG: hypothetical protein PHD81_02400 [Candidatus Nanoarchaeia archaeon]|nr:hypothetical protein [Candidatus Nanoarchaeia archaeon]MDD5587937.1 hypothetical protein [Candidatus Nanoarchaeia archaeon]
MHKKRVRDSFYYYTTKREGNKTKSIYLGRNLIEAKKKEAKILGFNSNIPHRNVFLIPLVLILLFFGFYFIGSYTGFFISNENESFFNESESISLIEPINNSEIIEETNLTEIPEEENITLEQEKSLGLSGGFELMDTTAIDTCGIALDTEGTEYQLQNNVNASSMCFNITASNIVLDCQGYKINFSAKTSSYGINNTGGYNNITIKNCNITTGSNQNLAWAIYMQKSDDNKIINNTIFSQGYGINLINVNNSYVINNTIVISASGRYAIYLQTTSENNTIISNTLKSNGVSANLIFIVYSKNNIFSKNILNASRGFGFNFAVTENRLQQMNHSIDDTNLVQGKPVNFTFNVSNVVYDGINYSNYGQVIFAACHNITLNYSNFTNHSLMMINSYNWTIDNNNFTSVDAYSNMYVYLSRDINITNNWFDGGTTAAYYNLDAEFSSGLNIINNTFNKATTFNLYSYSSNYNLIKNNNVTNIPNGGMGMYNYWAINNEYSNNSIYSSTGSATGISGRYEKGTRYYNNTIFMWGNNSNGYYHGSTAGQWGDNITFKGNNIQMRGVNSTGLMFFNNINISIEDSIINVTRYAYSWGRDINLTSLATYITTKGEINVTNCTNDYGGINISIIGGNRNNITVNVHHYLDIISYDTATSSFLNLANVSTFNRTDTLYKNGTTDINGNLTLTLQEYMKNTTGTFYHTNYTINATYGTYDSQTESINITGFMAILLNITSITNTCSYNSGDWNLNCADNCDLTTNYDLGGNNIYITNPGNIYLKSNITNFGLLDLSNDCNIILYNSSLAPS